MSGTAASLLITAVLLLLLGWFALANRHWVRLLRQQDPALFVDPVARPIEWATTAPTRMRRMWRHVRTPSSDARLERARLTVVHRIVVACALGALAIFGLGPFSTIMVGYVRAESGRDTLTAVVFIGAVAGTVGYWGWRLTRAMFRYGNGQSIRVSEALIPIAGLVAATLMAALVSATPAGRS